MSYGEILVELAKKIDELGQNLGWVRPKMGAELGVKYTKKNPGYHIGKNNIIVNVTRAVSISLLH